MGPESSDSTEADRLEGLWAGEFGDAYIARNPVLHEHRAAFWESLIRRHDIHSVLEVGCGQGGNLMRIMPVLDPARIWGVDVYATAVERARSNAPGTNVVRSAARALPFRDGFVDLAYTVGVLIHQPDDTLAQVMREIVRCTGRFVMWCEYYAPSTEEVPYHGERGTLFRRDYGAIYRSLVPGLAVVDEGYLEGEGWDRGTWQLLRRSGV
jgi:spore coat polysaccharide biosynthesis protein SpsF